MTFVRWLAAVTLTGVAVAACTSPTDGTQAAQPVITALSRPLTPQEKVAATATTEFGLALFRTVNASTARDSNIALSPVSASLALGMLMNGAEGQTFDEIRTTLGFGDRPIAEVNAAYKSLIPLLTNVDPSVTMKFANAGWFDLRAPSSAGFATTINDVFVAKVATLPLSSPATVKTINEWASANTNGRVPKIVDGIDASVIALLMNATYFKGKWREQFDAASTRSAPFRVTLTRTEQLLTMFNEKGLVRAGGTPDGTLIGELPYGGDAFVMDVIVPPLGTIEAAADALTPSRFRSLLALLPDSSSAMLLALPKFRLETGRELKPALGALGIHRAFGDAQLAPMFAGPRADAQVSSVLQKVFVDVNEEGTEAVAVTLVTVVERTSASPPQFVVDRPFLFVIRERLTGTILFLGKVARPVAP